MDRVNELWADDMRRDLRGWAGFFWQNWQQAADFCAQNKVDLPEALTWAQRAVSDPFAGMDPTRSVDRNGRVTDAAPRARRRETSPPR